MTRLVSLLVLAALAGCGADGEPVRPEPKRSGPVQVEITGTAEMGIRG